MYRQHKKKAGLRAHKSNIKRDLSPSKETYLHQKRPISIKRDLSPSKETYLHQKRPISIKRDLSLSKETNKRALRNRPSQQKKEEQVAIPPKEVHTRRSANCHCSFASMSRSDVIHLYAGKRDIQNQKKTRFH